MKQHEFTHFVDKLAERREPFVVATVVRIHGSSGKVHVVIGTRTSRAVVLGRVITIVCVLAILALLGWLSVGGFIQRRGRGKRATTAAGATRGS